MIIYFWSLLDFYIMQVLCILMLYGMLHNLRV